MAISLDKDGRAVCISCRQKKSISDLENCVGCDHFVCKSCATYRRQGSPYGYVCPSCYQKMK